VVDNSVVLDRKLEDMVQYMVENGDLTLVPSDFIKPAQQRVNYSWGQKGIVVDGGVKHHVQIAVIDTALLEDDKPKLVAGVIRGSEWGFLQVLELSSDCRGKAIPTWLYQITNVSPKNRIKFSQCGL
jgi:hypothetical protein